MEQYLENFMYYFSIFYIPSFISRVFTDFCLANEIQANNSPSNEIADMAVQTSKLALKRSCLDKPK